jgi:hypothetical protein
MIPENRKLSAEGRLMGGRPKTEQNAALCDYFFAQNEKGELTLKPELNQKPDPFFREG